MISITPTCLLIFLRHSPRVSLEPRQQLLTERAAQTELHEVEMHAQSGSLQQPFARPEERPGRAQTPEESRRSKYDQGFQWVSAAKVTGLSWRGGLCQSSATEPCRQTIVSQTHQDFYSCLILLHFCRTRKLGSFTLEPHLFVSVVDRDLPSVPSLGLTTQFW
jgi:hypothetical protein